MTTEGKRAYAAQLMAQKTIFYKRQILEKIEEMNKNLFGFDYSAWIERMKKENPEDKAIIIQAEREAFKEGQG